ncbi:MAG: AmmeMemoRadiSam system radical SAM enzyme, partial [Spirochaetales bacterium]|nr:AmmeMemoRadiSam system radical SAM enzyme [Spirochaetales bacterium]
MSDGSGAIRCDFCAHRCTIATGSRGICGVREHRGGRLVTTVYGQILAAATDKIEKKPLYHFLPGSEIFSVALGGCNFRCRFCQNASIAMPELIPEPRYRWAPQDAAEAWRRSKTPAIAWTYSEPTVWQDYLLDASV